MRKVCTPLASPGVVWLNAVFALCADPSDQRDDLSVRVAREVVGRLRGDPFAAFGAQGRDDRDGEDDCDHSEAGPGAATLTRAFRANPERFTRKPVPLRLPEEAWINDPSREATIKSA